MSIWSHPNRVTPFLKEGYNMLKIYAGIITYNPDMDKLKANVTAVLSQVDGLIVVDNGSSNLSDIKTLISSSEDSITLIENPDNKGVAYALNQIFKYADSESVDWVLTLDDDSQCYPNLVGMYKEFIDSNKVENLASLTCLREDRKYKEKNLSNIIGGADTVQFSQDFSFVDTCITSGNLVSVDAWMKVKGFNNKLFIDMVDDDFCLRLRGTGYNIVRISEVGYLHELGNDIIKVRFLGREKTVFAYSLKRKYYTARNVRYIVKTYNLGLLNNYNTYLIKRILGTLLYEKNKIKGLKAYIKGYKAGKKL